MAIINVHLLQEKIAINRDQIAYETMYLHFYNDLYSFAFSFVKRKEVAEEIISDVMLKIWTMETDLMRIHNLKVYLFIAVKNTALTVLSKNRIHISEIDDLPEISIDWLNPEKIAISKEINNLIEESIQKLPPKCKMAYLLVRKYGYKYKDAGAIMNISENTVDRHLQMAITRLSIMLKKHI